MHSEGGRIRERERETIIVKMIQVFSASKESHFSYCYGLQQPHNTQKSTHNCERQFDRIQFGTVCFPFNEHDRNFYGNLNQFLDSHASTHSRCGDNFNHNGSKHSFSAHGISWTLLSLPNFITVNVNCVLLLGGLSLLPLTYQTMIVATDR